mmetsp:Transcript_101009/g.290652  ORF Transcript_101009/g.290652 Transcript_101009/m.290652 type:complete len:213 (-) Transcript_101009:51-689(-)
MTGTLLGSWAAVPAKADALLEETHSPRFCRVELVATPLGPRMANIQPYHTSILIDGVEYAFSGCGLGKTASIQSHRIAMRNEQETVVIDMGIHAVDADVFYKKLAPHFRRGTYDVLRKNCNTFTDCALYYLTGRRLAKKYRLAETIGRNASPFASLIGVSGGEYEANPAADDFDVNAVIYELAQEKPLATIFGIPLCVPAGSAGLKPALAWW